jgi:hypothetical protein
METGMEYCVQFFERSFRCFFILTAYSVAENFVWNTGTGPEQAGSGPQRFFIY